MLFTPRVLFARRKNPAAAVRRPRPLRPFGRIGIPFLLLSRMVFQVSLRNLTDIFLAVIAARHIGNPAPRHSLYVSV